MQARLRIRHPQGESEWPVGPIRIGRAPDNDLIFDDESLSRHHAEIRWGRQGWVLHDLASANGVWVNGVRHPRYRLQPSITITLGKVPLIILCAETGVSPTKRWLVAPVIAGLVLLALWLRGSPQAPVQAGHSRGATRALHETSAPAAMTPEKALRAAQHFLEEGKKSAPLLAWAHRAAAWAATSPNEQQRRQALALQSEIDRLLDQEFQIRRLSYIHAKKLGDEATAQAALRRLRETFPPGDSRSTEIDRLEEMP